MMYFVSLKLQGSLDDADYETLKGQLEALGPWSNRMDQTWLVESNFSARRIRDTLKPSLKPGDRMFVGEFNTNWAGFGMGPSFPDWMQRRATIRPVPTDKS